MFKEPQKPNESANFNELDNSDSAQNSKGNYSIDDYMYFLSNGMSDNEKIDAYNYFDEFLDE